MSGKQKIRYEDLPAGRRFAVVALLFFVMSFFGWAAETIGFYLTEHAWYERGFLWLPFCPLYGFSLVGIYSVLRTPQTGVWRKSAARTRSKALRALLWPVSFAIYAILAGSVATLAEYLTGLFYHRFYGIRLWDYRGFPGNLGGYVVLQYSLLWGVGATAVMSLVWYPLRQVFARADPQVLFVTVLLLAAAMTADFIFNTAYLTRTGNHYPFFPQIFIPVCRFLRFAS